MSWTLSGFQRRNLQTWPPSSGCLFTLRVASLAAQSSDGLAKASRSVFSFATCAFGVTSKKWSPDPAPCGFVLRSGGLVGGPGFISRSLLCARIEKATLHAGPGPPCGGASEAPPPRGGLWPPHLCAPRGPVRAPWLQGQVESSRSRRWPTPQGWCLEESQGSCSARGRGRRPAAASEEWGLLVSAGRGAPRTSPICGAGDDGTHTALLCAFSGLTRCAKFPTSRGNRPTRGRVP